ncbi:Na/Pi cotransporter family protein [Martelella endophytica]|uniref:Sodium:phosphate symporter n=1 Tax=Martelella endophytica TaxID=1486262 RepID=A0A0D5LNT1_MAREN|nr:Na/Pi cotransporter family protein [Martelella endophytica]AJY45417.1 sodium:phosphate symporter [Martelella endophytica]
MTSIEVALQIAGSIALLLFGLSLVRAGMEEALGVRLKMMIGFGTQTKLRALFSGLLVTLGLQSSTATALLTASFVGRSLIDGRRAQIVLLGANVGTALTALAVSTGSGVIAPVLVLIGYVMRRRTGNVSIGTGNALIGIGLLLISLTILESATAPIRHSEALAGFMAMLGGALPVALVLAAGLALLCSSSLAAVLLVLSFPMPPALTVAMVLGANLGGALPAVIATAKDEVSARRLTIGNLIVRGAGCVIALPFVGFIADRLSLLPFGDALLAVETHVIFNLVLAALVWPFVGSVTRFVAWLIPDEEAPLLDIGGWLDDTVLDQPALALPGASREVLAIGDMAERMLDLTRAAFASNDTSHLAAVAELEERIDRRQHDVKSYLSRLGNETTEAERRRTINILDYVINIEHIGDIIDKGLGPEVRKKVGLKLRFSDEGYNELDRMFLMTQENLRMAQSLFMTGDRSMARRLVELKVDIRSFERQSSQRHLMRLWEGDQESHQTSSLHLDILRDLKRINAHAVSVAYPILDEQGLLFESRLRSGQKDKKKAKGRS